MIEKIILRAKRLILLHRLLPRRLDNLLDYYLVNIMSREQQYKYISYFYELSEDYLEKARNDFFHDWEKECIQRYFTNKESLLITSVGGGREAIMLVGEFKTIHATECKKRFFDREKQPVPDNVIMHHLGARELYATG